jgi:Cu(I)/Ag(I) efflux system protein CusF
MTDQPEQRSRQTMRGFALIAACLLAASATVQTVKAQELVDGQVTKIDETAGKITLRHGPIKKFDMTESMTMVFKAQDPTMLKSVKVGDMVKFEADRVNGQFTVTKIQKAK